MASPGTGQILGEIAVDTPSENITAVYPPKPVEFKTKKLETIKYNTGSGDTETYEKVEIVDVTQGIPYTSVPGVAKPAMAPMPPQLPRPVVVPVQNTTVFMENQLVTIDGDGVAGPGALPDPRILHGGSIYGTIIIGTNPIPIPI